MVRPHSPADLHDLARHLASAGDLDVEAHKPLAPFTSYRIGGPTDLWAAPRSEAAVRAVIDAARETNTPLFVLGRGSNVLVSDRGWRGITLYIGENLSGWHFRGPTAEVRAGTLWMELILEAVRRGLGGMEPMAGIPGGIGGALRMNAGAFGREIESLAVEVRGFGLNGSELRVPREGIDFGYRRAPQLEGCIITSAVFRFRPEPVAVLRSRIEEILRIRADKQPLECPSCGSVFKRPPGYYAGALIEAAGLKGARIGAAQVSRKHAGFILNLGGARAADVYRLMTRIEQRVLDRFGVHLEREVHLVGDFDS
jgi:UDP-N-acetylmuramate dehydrogenase